MGKISLIYILIAAFLLFGCSEKQSGAGNVGNDKTFAITFDSCQISYKDFDMSKDCFDCTPMAFLFFTLNDTQLADSLSKKNVHLSMQHGDILIDSIFLKQMIDSKVFYCSINLERHFSTECYYQAIRFGYKFLKGGNLYLSTRASDSIPRNTNFVILKSPELSKL